MNTVLLTGFEPFGGDLKNPSAEVALALHGTEVAGCPVVGVVLPCVFGAAARMLRRQRRLHRPKWVICLGVAAGRTEITPELVAINVEDARIADNAGMQPIDRPVVRGGPVGYWSTLPVKAIVAALRADGVPAVVSQTAGTFVCNHVFYDLMHSLRRSRNVRGGFVHVPAMAEAVAPGQAGLPLATMIRAARVIIATTVRTRRDRRLAGGALP